MPTPVSVGNKISQMTTGMSTCLTTGGRGESNTFFQNRLTLLGKLESRGEALSRESRIWVFNYLQVTTLRSLPKGNLLYSNKLYQGKEMVTMLIRTVAVAV